MPFPFYKQDDAMQCGITCRNIGCSGFGSIMRTKMKTFQNDGVVPSF